MVDIAKRFFQMILGVIDPSNIDKTVGHPFPFKY